MLDYVYANLNIMIEALGDYLISLLLTRTIKIWQLLNFPFTNKHYRNPLPGDEC